MNDAMMAWAFAQRCASPGKAVLLALAGTADDNGVTEVSLAELAYLSGYKRRTLCEALEYLRELGLISIRERRPQPSRFTLLAEAADLDDAVGKMRVAHLNVQEAHLKVRAAHVKVQEAHVEDARGAPSKVQEAHLKVRDVHVHRGRAELQEPQEQVTTPPLPPPTVWSEPIPEGDDLGACAEIARLAQNRNRRGGVGMRISAIAMGRLQELHRTHGGPAVRAALLRCGDADMPVERAAALLEPQARGGRRVERRTDPVPGRAAWGGG